MNTPDHLIQLKCVKHRNLEWKFPQPECLLNISTVLSVYACMHRKCAAVFLVHVYWFNFQLLVQSYGWTHAQWYKSNDLQAMCVRATRMRQTKKDHTQAVQILRPIDVLCSFFACVFPSRLLFFDSISAIKSEYSMLSHGFAHFFTLSMDRTLISRLRVWGGVACANACVHGLLLGTYFVPLWFSITFFSFPFFVLFYCSSANMNCVSKISHIIDD